MWHWLSHHFGLDNLSGPWYGFWSGVGSDIGELTIIAMIVGFVHHHTCHVKGCWRPGKHPHGPYKLCAKHHPQVPNRITLQHVNQPYHNPAPPTGTIPPVKET